MLTKPQSNVASIRPITIAGAQEAVDAITPRPSLMSDLDLAYKELISLGDQITELMGLLTPVLDAPSALTKSLTPPCNADSCLAVQRTQEILHEISACRMRIDDIRGRLRI